MRRPARRFSLVGPIAELPARRRRAGTPSRSLPQAGTPSRSRPQDFANVSVGSRFPATRRRTGLRTPPAPIRSIPVERRKAQGWRGELSRWFSCFQLRDAHKPESSVETAADPSVSDRPRPARTGARREGDGPCRTSQLSAASGGRTDRSDVLGELVVRALSFLVAQNGQAHLDLVGQALLREARVQA